MIQQGVLVVMVTANVVTVVREERVVWCVTADRDKRLSLRNYPFGCARMVPSVWLIVGICACFFCLSIVLYTMSISFEGPKKQDIVGREDEREK